MAKPFATYQGRDFTYPELYEALFGQDAKLAAFALDRIRLVEQAPQSPCQNEFARYFSTVELTTGFKFPTNCRSWRCPRCRYAWGRRWSSIISEQLEYTPATLLVNLTTSEMIDNETAVNALRRFIRSWRRSFGETEYIKVVEYNKKHTQPHFHLIFCCKEYKPEPYPAWWKDLDPDQQRKYSWPEDTWEFIKGMWQEALSFYAPTIKPTLVAWCQPVHSGQAATKYAVGYITGKSQKDKGEEPDASWEGRKLTYSQNFFTTPTGKIWERLLQRWFPDRPENPVFGLVVNSDECEANGIPLHLLTPQVKQKLGLVDYYQKFNTLPSGLAPPALEIEENDEGQLIFTHQESKVLLRPANLGGNRTLKAIRAMKGDL